MIDQAKYSVRNLVLGGGVGAPISVDLFEKVADAHDGLIDLIRVEDVYDVTMLNFAELEKVALSHVVDDMLDQLQSRIEWERTRRETDRAICNLLGSGKLYRDSARRVVAKIFGRHSDQIKLVQSLFDEQLHKHLGFRTMVALRDFTQHQGLPTESMTFNQAWVDHGDELKSRLQHSVNFSLDYRIFLSGRSPNPDLAQELVAIADKNGRVAMLPLIRAYMDGLSHIQSGLRALFSEREADWQTSLNDARTAFSAAGGDATGIALAVVQRRESGSVEKSFALNIEISERLAHLRMRNQRLINMAKRQIIS